MPRPLVSRSARAAGAGATAGAGAWASAEVVGAQLGEGPSGLHRPAVADSGEDTEEENKLAASLLTYRRTG